MILKRSQPEMEDRLRVRKRPESPPVLHMRWEQLLFLHWAWDAPEIQHTLPPGLFVDTFDGKGWLGIVPFFMKRVHPRCLPCVPWLSDFLELNVRTYVYDDAGLPGVWFYSLVCNQPLVVGLARRCFNLNYVHGRMDASVGRDGMCTYSARRRGSEEAAFRYGASGSKATAEPGSLEFFLVERYVLFSSGKKQELYSGKVHHVPYRIGPASVERWSFVPASADGFNVPARCADHTMVAESLYVEAWPITALPSVF
jgi:uncharacterized protein